MTFFIDADSLPKSLRPIILKAAVRTGAAAYFVADRPLKDVQTFIADDTHRLRSATNDMTQKSKIQMIVVTSGQDSADNYIVENCLPGSLCITHDIPLAFRLLEKKCFVIDDRGGTYDEDNIKSLLKDRDVNSTLREYGIFAEQQSKVSELSSIKQFADNFDRLITKLTLKENHK